MIDEENQLGGAENSAVSASEGSSAAASTAGDTMNEEAVLDVQEANAEDAVASHASGADSTPLEIASGDPSMADHSAALMERETEINALKVQLEERTNQCVRIAADFDNYRKRTQREREELEQQIKCSTINELLPVVDNFERARSHIKPQTDAETTIHKSYQSVYKQLVECLKRIGVAPMRSEGKEFDPTMHEAVMRQPTADQPEGTVMEELQRGYMLGDRVLRHALVKVAAAPDPTADPDVPEPGQDG